MRRIQFSILASLLLSLPRTYAQDADILIADFEGEGYGDWTAVGEAFGPGPAKGTLPGQMQVSGFQGQGLVNSFYKGDRTTGSLTSPPLKIERSYLTFLIGGGGYEGETCLNLLLEGKVVRTATGPNVSSGGSEELAPAFWDVSALSGKIARIEIVDRRTGGWGHINVDQIVQSNQKPDVPKRPGLMTRELTIAKRYLLFPVRTGAPGSRIHLSIDGENVREFDAELASTKAEASFWSFLDLAAWQGHLATLTVNGTTEETFSLIAQSDQVPGEFYDEPLRPQFHFSQKLGWNNDPNGMVHYAGEWHLYFQHNPYGWKWGNMHWGHAVSKDLVHWEQLPIAIYNNRHGDWAFSGSAVVDEKNTAGWQIGEDKVIVASWTSTGRGECIAYSNDRGRTFTEYQGNPVVKHNGRDPKIIWYAPGSHWVMAVYTVVGEPEQRCIAFYTSADLKQWEFQSRLNGYYECPEIFELPIEGDRTSTRWIVFAADARYAVGSFDGKTFTPEHEGKHRLHYGEYYASQLFNNPPSERRIQIGWARIPMPDMPFNQTFTFPHQLTLRRTEDGLRLFAQPVEEIDKLHRRRQLATEKRLTSDLRVALPVSGGLFDIRATFEVGTATKVGLDLGGEQVQYDVKERSLRDAPMSPVEGKVTLQILVDRPMLEIIGNQGRVYITAPRMVHGEMSSVEAFAEGGEAKLVSLEVYELNSIW